MKIDQALFGYDGGHRLLASSLPLGLDAALLTELSDLAPGAIFGSGDGYWTGLPLPAMKKYALLRTWPAPEMPRPGCVWTHALLLDPKVLELLDDLSTLKEFARRPASMMDIDKYKEAFLMPLNIPSTASDYPDSGLTANLIFNLYGQKEAVIRTATPGELVAPLFSVWSQQWPRLRRNFKFQTALTRSSTSSNSIRLDITTLLVSTAELTTIEPPQMPWVRAAQKDIYEDQRGPLRKFLWKYGSDVKKQKASFRPLVELSLLDNAAAESASEKVLQILTKAFPITEDASILKQDLVNGDVIPNAQPGLILYLLDSRLETLLLPMPNASGLARIADLDPRNTSELIQIADHAITSTSQLAPAVQDLLVEKLSNSSQIWILENASSNLARFLCKRKPSLVTEKTISHLSDDDLIHSLPFIVTSDSFTTLVGNILARENENLAAALFDLTPKATAAAVLRKLSEASWMTTSVWVRELFKRNSILLDGSVLESALTLDAIFECANGLGWLSPMVERAGCAPWISGIKTLNPNIPSPKEEYLAAFFIVLALKTGQRSGLLIVERFFDVLHSRIIDSDLNRSTVDFLLPHLADVNFFKSWDLGLRFRLSVIDAYVKFNWPRNSYLNLTHRKKVRKMLAEAASDTTNGEHYVDSNLL